MATLFQHTKDCSVYPGEFVPMPDSQLLLNELKVAGSTSKTQPPVNIDEFEDYFKIEMAVPGVQREELMVAVDENILSIIVLHKNQEVAPKKAQQLHEFDKGSYERHIFLPANTDAELIIAEYKLGILNLYVPKGNPSSKISINSIVVY